MRKCSGFLITLFHVTFGSIDFNNTSPCDLYEFVPRDEWRARPPTHDWLMKRPLNMIIILHTATVSCHNKHDCIRDVQIIQDYHLDHKGWSDIAYNFLVGGDGRVYEGIGWTEAGAHSINYNTRSIGIALIGNFEEQTPSPEMMNATYNLIECGVRKMILTPSREIYGHRDVACSIGPGQNAYVLIRQWKGFKGGRMKDYDCSEF